jgi:hypothetical protein
MSEGKIDNINFFEEEMDNMNWFEEEEDVLSFSCKVDHISSLLFQTCHVLHNNGRSINNIHDIVSEITKYNKDINIFCEKTKNFCSIAIVFFRNGDYSKDFLDLILKLKKELIKYERINFVKILPL